MAKNLQLTIPLEEANDLLTKLSAASRLQWAIQEFGSHFALTTSFGIQSSVLLHMIQEVDKKNTSKIIWIDTGYLPPETYQYVETLTNQLQIEVHVAQSEISPARMEALYGKLWEANSLKNLDKYNSIRKVKPLEKAFNNLNINCWGSGVRRNQTDNRKLMNFIDPFNKRLALRPLLDWTQKDIFYYMKENHLPQHPLFEKGYSTVGDWHSSKPDNSEIMGRKTRFSGLKQECGIHLPEIIEDEETN